MLANSSTAAVWRARLLSLRGKQAEQPSALPKVCRYNKYDTDAAAVRIARESASKQQQYPLCSTGSSCAGHLGRALRSGIRPATAVESCRPLCEHNPKHSTFNFRTCEGFVKIQRPTFFIFQFWTSLGCGWLFLEATPRGDTLKRIYLPGPR